MLHKTRDSKGRFATGNGQGSMGKYLHQIKSMIQNATFSRARLARSLLDPRRSINDECGYPETEEITTENYKDLYDREPVANRVVQVLPVESWQASPTVFETENVDQETAFEAAWGELPKSLRGESWYQDEEGNPIWEHLQRIDVLSGIGRFGVLLIGIDDGKPLADPIEPRKDTKLIYLRSFDESSVSISDYDRDTTSTRFGQPIRYSVKFSNVASAGFVEQQIHWTRVIHVADNLGSSEFLGVPRQQAVFNRLYDLRKIYSSDAEAYWLNVVMKLFLETQPNPEGSSGIEVDMDSIKADMEKFYTGLQRFGLLQGLTAKTVSPQVVDPTAHVDIQIEAICIEKDIPKRIFTGSERGELASSQDKSRWNGRLMGRNQRYTTPRIIVPFTDRLIWVGILPEPEGYSVVWPDLDALTEEQQAAIALKRTEALAKYIQGEVESVVAPLDYLTRIQGMPADEAEAVLEARVEDLGQTEGEEDGDEQKEDTPIL